MNTKLLALASALVATTALASAAEAGGGVRLGFGFPLGVFTATPSHGGGGDATTPRRSKQVKRTAPSSSVREAARKSDTPAPSKTAKSDESTSTASETTGSAPLTGSTALIQQSTPVESNEATVEPASTQPEVKAEAPASSTPSSVASVDKGPSETDAAGTCKKYVPAIGTTVSVGCDE